MALMRSLWKGWWLVVVGLVLGATVAAVTSSSQTPLYAATSEVFVSVTNSSNPTELAQGGDFIESRMSSYAKLATSVAVLEPTINDLGLDLTTSQLASKTEVSSDIDTVILTITVTDENAERSAALSTAVVTNLRTAIDMAEPTNSEGDSVVSLFVARQAEVPLDPESPRPALAVLAGGFVGAMLGLTGAVLSRRLNARPVAEDPAGFGPAGA